ncbi:universal stress protein [Haloarchaeobius baliensis]|uniref:universal stress protein n=1 Tax=Haloarchaeobius baliensis TaxID=1670458 RepID=UPI003F882E8D
MYETLLVATDGSDRAAAAVTHGLELAERDDATVYAIHVVDTRREGEPALSSAELVLDEREDEGWRRVDEIERLAAERGLDANTKVCHGRPAEEILRYADEADVDLLVLGYSGEGHTRTDTIGHVSERVVKDSNRPVLLV